MNGKYKSFLVCYIIVPIVFYTVDGFLHSGLLRGLTQLLLIQFGLPVIAWILFRCLLVNKFITIDRPLPGAWGASLGLIHSFPIYLEIGSLYIWGPVGESPIDSRTVLLYLVNLVLPIMTYSGAAYDGTFLVIPISILLFLRVATKKLGIPFHKVIG